MGTILQKGALTGVAKTALATADPVAFAVSSISAPSKQQLPATISGAVGSANPSFGDQYATSAFPCGSVIGIAAAAATASGLAQRPRGQRRQRRVKVRNVSASEPLGRQALNPASTATLQGKTGVILLNIGTPASLDRADIRDYLSKFLGDDRVLEVRPNDRLPGWVKRNVILPIVLATRPKEAQKAYSEIWDPERGSPLLFHTEDLVKGLQQELGPDFEVRIGMQYSEPFADEVISNLSRAGCDKIVLFPMYPQYASSTTGAALDFLYKKAASMYNTPFLVAIPPYYDNPLFIEAMEKRITEAIGPQGEDVEHLLFSFHGVPETQCKKTDYEGLRCQRSPVCCSQLDFDNRNCYRAQCYETARAIAKKMSLKDGTWSVSFQSRLTLRDTIKWIEPYTDVVFADLARRGIRKLAVVAPSFTIDCVETLEELAGQGTEQFEEAGGEKLVVIPCVNSADYWASGVAKIIGGFFKDMGMSVRAMTDEGSQDSNCCMTEQDSAMTDQGSQDSNCCMTDQDSAMIDQGSHDANCCMTDQDSQASKS